MKIQNNGQEIRLLPPIRRYAKAIERRLNLPRPIRNQVMSDVLTGITARHEAGEALEDIMRSMGTPKEVAAGINEEMAASAYRKSPWRWACLAVAIGALLWLGTWGVWLAITTVSPLSSAMGMIGGADGPTVIFVTSAAGGHSPVWDLLPVLLLAAAGLFGFLRLRKLRQKP